MQQVPARCQPGRGGLQLPGSRRRHPARQVASALDGGATQAARSDAQGRAGIDGRALPWMQIIAARCLDLVARGQVVAVTRHDRNQAGDPLRDRRRPGDLVRADSDRGFQVVLRGSQEVPENGTGHYPPWASSLLI